MYAQVIDKSITQIVDEQTLRHMYPSTHFPAVITKAALEGFENWYVVEDDTTVPEYDKLSKKIEFARSFNGKSVVGKYAVVNLTDEEKAALKESRWLEVRYHRDNTLNSTDYLMMSDLFNSFSVADQEKIVQYRQALRDLTDQENPFAITWPSLGIDSVSIKYNTVI